MGQDRQRYARTRSRGADERLQRELSITYSSEIGPASPHVLFSASVLPVCGKRHSFGAFTHRVAFPSALRKSDHHGSPHYTESGLTFSLVFAPN